MFDNDRVGPLVHSPRCWAPLSVQLDPESDDNLTGDDNWDLKNWP